MAETNIFHVVIRLKLDGKMGIFDLFKPSPEELKAKEDAERARYLVENEKWDQLADIGKPAVKPLISCVKDTNDVDTLIQAARVLGRIGDVEAIEALGFSVFNTDAALNDIFDWDRYTALVPVVADALTSIGKSNVEYIIKFLGKKDRLLLDGIPFIWSLCEVGDEKAAEAVLNWFFSVGPTAPIVPGSMGEPITFKGKLLSPPDLIRAIIPPTVMPKLLGDYTDLILDVFAWEPASYSEEGDQARFDESRCKKAIQKLCEIETFISNNILHKISQIEKVNVGLQFSTHQSQIQYLDFEQNRLTVREELKRRGNPPYDPTVYSDQDAWKI